MNRNHERLLTVSYFVLLTGLVGLGFYWFSVASPARITGNHQKSPSEQQVLELTTDFQNGMVFRGTSGAIADKINPALRVTRGDSMTLKFTNRQGVTHDIAITGLGLETDAIGPGETTTLRFRPEKTGTFTYYCSVADHRDNRMEGKLIVRDP